MIYACSVVLEIKNDKLEHFLSRHNANSKEEAQGMALEASQKKAKKVYGGKKNQYYTVKSVLVLEITDF